MPSNDRPSINPATKLMATCSRVCVRRSNETNVPPAKAASSARTQYTSNQPKDALNTFSMTVHMLAFFRALFNERDHDGCDLNCRTL